MAAMTKKALEAALEAAAASNNANDRVEAKVDALAKFLLSQPNKK